MMIPARPTASGETHALPQRFPSPHHSVQTTPSWVGHHYLQSGTTHIITPLVALWAPQLTHLLLEIIQRIDHFRDKVGLGVHLLLAGQSLDMVGSRVVTARLDTPAPLPVRSPANVPTLAFSTACFVALCRNVHAVPPRWLGLVPTAHGELRLQLWIVFARSYGNRNPHCQHHHSPLEGPVPFTTLSSDELVQRRRKGNDTTRQKQQQQQQRSGLGSPCLRS